MNNLSINKVSITIKPNAYKAFQNLNNTISNVLSEYVDNAVQSFLSHKEKLFSINPDYKLRIEIKIDVDNDYIIIEDNAAGIDKSNYLRAFEPANIPNDNEGLNEFGLGMKTASVWLANKWSVSTKALGEMVERCMEFNLQEVMDEQKVELPVVENIKPLEEHYTRIRLSQLSTNAPKTKQIDKVRKHLSSIYRYFLRKNIVDIFVNEKPLEAPNFKILHAPYYATPDANSMEWKCEIKIENGKYKAKGFVAILDKIQNGASGLVLMRRGRVIVGGGEERFFPHIIFGQSGSFRHRRLFGEIELEGFEVSFNKDSIKEKDDLDNLMELLRNELKKNEYSILRQVDNYRQRNKKEYKELSRSIKKDLVKYSKFEQYIDQISATENKIENKKCIENNAQIIDAHILDSHKIDFKHNGVEYSLSIDLFADSKIDSLYSVIEMDADNKKYSCKINIAHSFFTQTEYFKQAKYCKPVISIFIALSYAEIIAPQLGTKSAVNIRDLFNKYIREYGNI